MRPGRAAGHSPPSRAEVFEEQSYTLTPVWATTGPLTGLLYLYLYLRRDSNPQSQLSGRRLKLFITIK